MKKKAGGARPGAGRKPALSTQIRQHALEEKNGDAVAAFDLIVKWMYDEDRSEKFRKECAVEVMNRVWGKSTQTQVSKNFDVEIKVSYTNDWRNVVREIGDTVDGESREIES